MSDAGEIAFPAPWRPLESQAERDGLPRQLAIELVPEHPLWGMECAVIGRADTNDDILVRCADGTYVIVHLTWSQGPGTRDYPGTIRYADAAEVNDALWRDAVWQGFVEDFDPDDPRLRT